MHVEGGIGLKAHSTVRSSAGIAARRTAGAKTKRIRTGDDTAAKQGISAPSINSEDVAMVGDRNNTRWQLWVGSSNQININEEHGKNIPTYDSAKQDAMSSVYA
ncbi:hypothetical protein HPP92_000808 [Vanilla planifolia]|uniref:Uncharacterized protein n=1 Tax=Vanilla planifolia TaxID=51239 RepID=A0A835VES0_VANPL|nr:hypothetical protein HPP92_000808 [Vanilla planifolia]